eukprot:COSAG05_NODE_649_length_8102_cov_157.470823_10_plen_69_part_00
MAHGQRRPILWHILMSLSVMPSLSSLSGNCHRRCQATTIPIIALALVSSTATTPFLKPPSVTISLCDV